MQDDGDHSSATSTAETPATPRERRFLQRAVLRRVLNGQRLLATVIGVLGVPTVVLTGFNTYLALRPDVVTAVSWSPQPQQRLITVTNLGAHSLYNISVVCYRRDVGGAFPADPSVVSSGGNESPVVGSHLTLTSPISDCNPKASPASEVPPAYLAITLCYRDDIPQHIGSGTFGFRYETSSKQYVIDDVAADSRLNIIAHATRETCTHLLKS